MKGSVVAFLGLMLTGAVLVGCSDSSGTKRVLEAQGYSQVETTGYDWFACPDKDLFSTGFKAYSANGTPVSGAVCRGILFGSQVRID